MSKLQSIPLVSVVTPVYNGAKYLAECIESVLGQSYQNWEYTIVNNCSTDDSLKIAQSYKDPRIRVISNDRFVSAIENHNIAFRNISSQSKYCKVVSADDWLYPECIEKMVAVAEANPSVGIVQSYVVNANGVRWPRIPIHKKIIDGREAGRLYLLGKIEFSGIPSSNLFRSSLIRSSDPFFPGANSDADAAACLRCLQHCDLGVVHQVLAFERIHNEAITSKVRVLESYLPDRLELLSEFGPYLLSTHEVAERMDDILRYYYETAAKRLLIGDRVFTMYHKKRMEKIGLRFYSGRLLRSLFSQIFDLLLNPKSTFEKSLSQTFHSM